MKTLGEYLADRIWLLAGFAFVEALVFLTLWLEGSTLCGAGYALAVGCGAGLLAGIRDCLRYVKKRRQLRWCRGNISETLDGLPEKTSSVEGDYQELLAIVFSEKARMEASFSEKRQELLDYYSLWVHQIKTPIAGMHLLLQAWKNGMLSKEGEALSREDAMELNTRLQMELARTEQYAQMALSYLRSEDMGKDLVFREYEVAELVREAAKKFSREFLYRKLRLRIDEFSLSVVTDRKWLLFVLEQVISNAVKYTPEGGEVHIFEQGGILIIADTGIGIQAEDLPRVFEKGFTGYNGREHKKSTGIGLYLCRRVMDGLNHRMEIQSKPGKGTRVLLLLGRENLTVED
ncbi:sensor histidine kinase [Candidatus Bariatricus faecipullorum]